MTTQPRGAADLEGLLAVLPDALSAMTEGSDYAPAPKPSDEPGSEYVVGLAHMIVAGLNRLAATKQDSTDTLLEQNRVLQGLYDECVKDARRMSFQLDALTELDTEGESE